MKNIKLLLLIIALLSTSFLSACGNNSDEKKISTVEQNQTIDIEKTAKSFVLDLVHGDYEKAYNSYVYNIKMKNAVNPNAYKGIMEQLYTSVGDYKSVVSTSKSKKEIYEIVSVTCEFEKDTLNLNVVFDQNKSIAGFNFSKPDNIENSEKLSDKVPSTIEEKEVIVGDGDWKLPGTLTLPKGDGPFPAVVLIHGSGPNDRDETIGLNKPFRDLAWGLAEKGIAVLRYDKRTLVYANEMAKIKNDVTVKEEVIDDALSAVQLLREQNKIDKARIFVLGHSLGGYLIPRIGVENEDIAGFIILAGATRPLQEVIVEQFEYLASLDGNISKEEQAKISEAKTARDNINSPELNDSINANELMGVNAKYWLDLRDYEPTSLVKELDRPILVLQGERDYQVTMEDFNRWKKALENEKDVEFKTFAKLNHLFLEGEGQPSPTEYSKEGKVSPLAIDSISEWVFKH